ncbi:hypothetical protein [Thermosipho atlanticus]|uniref:Uncharacterized protein n=1 Tax=Thermosipho atlanticus DSM 15807 TaxID=1123380 RepID=A0A1M5SFW8_9BACT|nr:hypothetical protein [Thermosipho atlanticus]SHH37487.1 hypothetical protein SAMN02745199_0856 [Thermosipho atlanticus DSM 15807]
MNWEQLFNEIKEKCPECVKCGFCCKHTPCYYGKWDEEQNKCIYLTEDNLCGIYDQIIELEKNKPSMERMFGSGCCLNYMNPDRLKIIREKQNEKNKRGA